MTLEELYEAVVELRMLVTARIEDIEKEVDSYGMQG